ncbi:MAG: class I SAM-dependent methyltransferase, partial [Gammaproteobacteria bacterium]|nr:class I SAM-dependent methyltransferase [Gammaproteobacteria bacterium]
MTVKADISVEVTLECEPELLPYLPELLQDFEALGSAPDAVIELLEAEAAGDFHSVLDLCCGKGATSIAVAKHFGVNAHGVDAVPGFIEAAKAAAEAAGLGAQCSFAAGDICDVVVKPADYDLVLFSAIGPILGGITKTVEHLIRPLRPGGWLLIEDSVLKPGTPVHEGFEMHASFDDTRVQMEQAGVDIVTVKRLPVEFVSTHEIDHSAIEKRAAALVERKPELAELVKRYVEGQWEEVDFLENWT